MAVIKLGIREWLEKQGHEFIVSEDKEGPDSVFQKHLVDVSCSLIALRPAGP